MNYRRYLLFLLIIPFLAFGMHKYYISLTKIEFVKEQKSVQVTMKFFIDDIELALQNRHGESMELATKFENENAGQYLETYVKQKFRIWIDDKECLYNYLGREYENDEVFIYLEIQDIDAINSITVKNSMLLEEFEDQQNYVKLKIGSTQKTLILVKANDKEMLKL